MGVLRIDRFAFANWEVMVVPLAKDHDLIIGMPFLHYYDPEIRWKKGVMIIATEHGKVVLRSAKAERPEGVSFISAAQVAQAVKKKRLEEIFLVLVSTADIREGQEKGNWSEIAARKVAEWTEGKYKDVFQDTPPPGLPPEHGDSQVEHAIRTLPDATPPCRPPYRLSPAEKEELQRQLTRLLQLGHIRPSCSPYGAPVLFVKKKTPGEFRMCIDYRGLNAITIKDRYPLPRIDDLLDRLHGAKYFTALDLTNAYNQIRVREEDIHKTAFRTEFGHFEYLVLPFGLTGAPATFQRAVTDLVVKPLGNQFLDVYLDDLLIFSKTLEEHIQHVEAVLAQLQRVKLYCRLGKCQFFQHQVPYLGHVVSAKGIEVDQSKVQVIKQWPAPNTRLELMSFLGAANFFRRFIRRFSHEALPLTQLLEKDTPYVWGAAQQRAFEALKQALSSAPVLQPPDFSKPFIINTDASELAVGAVLMQDHGEGPQPVAYYSRRHTPAERKYSARDK